ncbi:unnamed protein product [Cochlearia groenlandica]
MTRSGNDGDVTKTTKTKRSSEDVRWEKYLPKTVLKVLLVESDDSTRQIITSLLQKCSYEVIGVSDGLAAWEILKEKSNNIDIILTELDLLKISGFELLALVMENDSYYINNIPVVMMSCQDSITMVFKCMMRGAVDFLIKPIRRNELKHLWQHVWRRLTARNDHTAYAHSLLPASQHNLEDTDETSANSKSDQQSGSQGISYNGPNKRMENVKSLDGFKDSGRFEQKLQSSDVTTMDLIGGVDKRSECLYGDNTDEEEYVGPELELSLKRYSSGSFEKQDESKHQKLSLSGASAFSRYENSKGPADKAAEGISSVGPNTPTESHEKLRCDQGSTTTSSNQENIGSSSINGHCGEHIELSVPNQVVQSAAIDQAQDLKASKEVEVGCLSTGNNKEEVTGQSKSTEKQQRRSQREAALMKFRSKRKVLCFDKKVRYQSRKKLAEERPRVKGQFVRTVNAEASSTKA